MRLQINTDSKLADLARELDRTVNGGLDLFENFDGRYVEVTLKKGKNEIQHQLGRVPVGWFLLLQDAPGEICGHRIEEWTNQKLSLQSSVANLKVRLFVL